MEIVCTRKKVSTSEKQISKGLQNTLKVLDSNWEDQCRKCKAYVEEAREEWGL